MSNYKIKKSEFLIFTNSSNNSIDVVYYDKNIWLTQKSIAELFEIDRTVITKHLKKVFLDGELQEDSVSASFAHTASDGKKYNTKYYSLEAVIAVGYKVNSSKAVEFRAWATTVIKTFSIQGYVLDRNRLENGKFIEEDYFEKLLEEIREIRLSERRFYQKITDIYSTAVDYNPDSNLTLTFFKAVQNKLHFAIHGNTAAGLIVNRADHQKENMGLTSWQNAPDGKIIKSDVVVAKNYLNEEELKTLAQFVSMYLDYAELQAKSHTLMTMDDWKTKLDAFLKFNEKEILYESGKVSHEIAKAFAEKEFELYRVIQDQKYLSDFDKFLIKTKKR